MTKRYFKIPVNAEYSLALMLLFHCRYWSHVVSCSSCKTAYKCLNALEVALQIASVALLGISAVTKQSAASAIRRNAVIVMAVLCSQHQGGWPISSTEIPVPRL